jgi:hypothetical protein
MLDMLRWIALASAVVCVVAFAGVIVSRSSTPPNQQEQSAEHNNEHTNKESNKSLWDTWFPDALALYTLALVVFTAVLAFGGLYQLRALERAELISAESAKAAKDSAEVASKTLVSANRPWISAEVKIASDLNFGTSPAAQLFFEFVLKNTGNTPGINVEIYPQLMLIEFGKVTGNPPDVVMQSLTTSPPEALAKLCEMARLSGDAPFPAQPFTGDAIFPNGQITERVGLQLTAEQIEKAKQTSFYKVINLVLLTCVNYKSPLEKMSHQTGYIFNIFTNDPTHPNGIDPNKGNISIKNLGLTRTFSNSFAN